MEELKDITRTIGYKVPNKLGRRSLEINVIPTVSLYNKIIEIKPSF